MLARELGFVLIFFDGRELQARTSVGHQYLLLDFVVATRKIAMTLQNVVLLLKRMTY